VNIFTGTLLLLTDTQGGYPGGMGGDGMGEGVSIFKMTVKIQLNTSLNSI